LVALVREQDTCSAIHEKKLFIDHDLRDVLMTSRDDALCVVFLGEPRITEWTRILTEAGFPAPQFGGPPADAINESLFHAAA
jgi:hypothetical protein